MLKFFISALFAGVTIVLFWIVLGNTFTHPLLFQTQKPSPSTSMEGTIISTTSPPTLPEVEAPAASEETNEETGFGETTTTPPTPVVVADTIPVTDVIVTKEIETESSPPVVLDETLLSFADINTTTRLSLVNIICTTSGAGPLNPISGSGIIIDDRGIILTNAHIAQYFLLSDYLSSGTVNCVIRTGSPAQAMYRAEPLYVSPQWVAANSNNLALENPTGTGEFDFALLHITEHVNPKVSVPSSFKALAIQIDDSSIVVNDQVLLAAYPAEFLGGTTIQKDLYVSSAISAIRELFTFVENSLDLISVGGSVVAQQGSSGGAVVNDRGKLIGIIVTSTGGDTTEERDLRAVTLSHINRALQSTQGVSLETFLRGNLAAKAALFKAVVEPELAQILLQPFNN